jgi:hypothetical protein
MLLSQYSAVMKRLLSLLSPLLLMTFAVQPAHAATPTIILPASIASQPNIVVTAFGGGQSDFIELYNQAAEPVSLAGSKVQITVTGLDATNVSKTETYTIALPSAWLLSKQYFMIQRGSLPAGTPAGSQLQNILYHQAASTIVAPKLTSIALDTTVITPAVNTPPVPAPLAQNEWVQHKQRGNTSLKMTGVFATDYGAAKTTTPTGNADALYMPASTSHGLQILELLPNARACGPTESAYDCGDYVKLHNPTNAPIDLSLYRLRSDSGGLKSSSSNTFALGGLLNPGEYAVVNTRASGDPISLTNTGGYVWLEDAWGVKIYDDPIAYPDASLDSKKGQSWAVDGTSTWLWMPPQPTGPNYWPPVVAEPLVSSAVVSTLTPCKEGQERNLETNRCRNIVSLATTLTPCKTGQERSSETNRCRSVLATSTALTPCKPGETRNTETNRCRKNTTTASTLTTCKPGQERSAETNRCRKSQSAVNTASITDVKTNQLTNKRAWWLAAIIIIAALAYAIYEYRQDLRLFKVKR